MTVKTLEKVHRDGTYDEGLPYVFDFSAWDLLTTTELLVSAVVDASPPGLTIGAITVSPTDKKVSVVLSGGTSGTTYTVFCKATTTSSYTPIGVGYLHVVNPPNVP